MNKRVMRQLRPRTSRVCTMSAPVDRSMMVSAPHMAAHCTLATSSSIDDDTALFPKLALIFTLNARPTMVGSSSVCLRLAARRGGIRNEEKGNATAKREHDQARTRDDRAATCNLRYCGDKARRVIACEIWKKTFRQSVCAAPTRSTEQPSRAATNAISSVTTPSLA